MAEEKIDSIQKYLNSLNEAMAIHAKSAISGLEFDRTELAEIVDITNRDKGEYQVFNGSTRYYAYSENTSYTLKTKVYVTIPNNDYSQQKLIKGKYKSGDDDVNIAWTSPLDGYNVVTDNLLENETYKLNPIEQNGEVYNNNISSEFKDIEIDFSYDNAIGSGLLANYDGQIASSEIENNPYYAAQYKVLYQSKWLRESEYNSDFTYMGLSAEFKTALSGFYPVSGSYGLLVLIDYSIKLSGEQDEIKKLKVCKLDTSTMIGNVYNFNTFYKQEALFKLDKNKDQSLTIDRVAVLFYQDGRFRNNNNALISPYYNEMLLDPNIFVKNIGIWFGDEKKEEDSEDEVSIYTRNGLMYDSAQENEKINEKRIHLKWLHVNPEQEIQDDGTRKWIKELMKASDLKNIPSAADVKIIAKIHWYTDGKYKIETVWTNIENSTDISNDNFLRITEKWKYAPNSLTNEEKESLIKGANWVLNKDYTYRWDENNQMYIDVSASGEKALEKVITRKSRLNTENVTDDLAGAGWTPILEVLNQFEFDFQPDVNRQSVKVKCLIEIGPELILFDEDDNEIKTGNIDTTSMYYTILESNELIFENLSYVPDETTDAALNGIKITAEDGTDGNYPIYSGVTNMLLDGNQASILRELRADMVNKYTGHSLLNGNEIILWQIPKSNTMINVNGTFDEDREQILSENVQYLLNIDNKGFKASIEEVLRTLEENLNKIIVEGDSTEEQQENFNKEIEDIKTVAEEIKNELSDYIDAYKESAILLSEEKENSDNDENLDNEDFVSIIRNSSDISELEKNFTGALVKCVGKPDNGEGRTNIIEKWEDKSESPENWGIYYEAVMKAREEALKYIEQAKEKINSTSKIIYPISDWFNTEEDFDFDNYYYIVRFGTKESAVNNLQGYYINKNFIKSNTNNTIYCYLIKNNKVYNGNISLSFSQYGSSGTDYTFTLGLGPLIYPSEEFLNAEWGTIVNEEDIDLLENFKEFVRLKNELASQYAEDSEEYQQALSELQHDFNSLTMYDIIEEYKEDVVDYGNINWDRWERGGSSVSLTIGEIGFRRILFDLYDSAGKKVELTADQKNSIISKWIERSSGGFYSGQGNANNLQFLIKATKDGNNRNFEDIAVRVKPGVSINDCRYIIMSAAVRNSATSTYKDNEYELGPINFVQMLPIHIKTESKYFLNGPDFIVYDDKGANPQVANDPYEILNAEIDSDIDYIIKVNGVNVNNASGGKYYPTLDEYNKLIPCAIYVSSLDKKVDIEVYINDSLSYTAPILIIQNRYQIPGINSWNGQLVIDEDNNRVMAATVAAGHKNNDNTFTGVIMGDVGQQDQSTGKVKTTTGLYGYESGAEAFGFKSDGTAFIGKSGTGRIEFDGNNGYIRSANYNITKKNINPESGKTPEGTEIDLQNGSIDMWGKGYFWKFEDKEWKAILEDGNSISTNVHLDTIGSQSKPYFRIGVPIEGNVNGDTDGLKSLIRIDKENYYLQTANYGEQSNSRTGLKIDLKNGIFDSNSKLTINGYLGSVINFGDELNYVKLGIDNSGKSYLDMKYSGISLQNLRTSADQLINLADELNDYLYGSHLNRETPNYVWEPVNPSISPFSNLTSFSIEGYEVKIIKPIRDNYATILQGKLAEKRIKASKIIGTLYDESKEIFTYLNEGVELIPYVVEKNNNIYTITTNSGSNITLQELKEKGILYFQSEENFIENVDGEEVVVDTWTHFEEIEDLDVFLNNYFNEEEDDDLEEDVENNFIKVYTKGYNNWKEPIEPWQEDVSYDKNMKVYEIQNDDYLIYSSLKDNNKGNSVLNLDFWESSVQDFILNDSEKELFDNYIEITNRTNTTAYEKTNARYTLALSYYNEANEQLTGLKQELTQAQQIFESADNTLQNSLHQLESDFNTYNDIVDVVGKYGNTKKEIPVPDSHFYDNLDSSLKEYFPKITSVKGYDFVFPYYEEFKKIYDKEQTQFRDFYSGFSYQELLKVQQEAAAKLEIVDNLVTNAKDIYWSNEWGYNKNSTKGFAKLFNIRDSETKVNTKRFNEIYSKYVEYLNERKNLFNDLTKIKNYFLKDVEDNDLDEDFESELDLTFDYNSTKDYFNSYRIEGYDLNSNAFFEFFIKNYFIEEENNNHIEINNNYSEAITKGINTIENNEIIITNELFPGVELLRFESGTSILERLNLFDEEIKNLEEAQINYDENELSPTESEFSIEWVPYNETSLYSGRLKDTYNFYLNILDYNDKYIIFKDSYDNWRDDPENNEKRDIYLIEKTNLINTTLGKNIKLTVYIGNDCTPENENNNVEIATNYLNNTLLAGNNLTLDKINSKVNVYEKLIEYKKISDSFGEKISILMNEKNSYESDTSVETTFTYLLNETNYTITVIRSFLINDYYLLQDIIDANEKIVELDETTVKYGSKSFLLRYFNGTFEYNGVTYDNFNLYDKYNRYLDLVEDQTELKTHIEYIKTLVSDLKKQKEAYEGSIFISVGKLSSATNFNNQYKNYKPLYYNTTRGAISKYIVKNTAIGIPTQRDIGKYTWYTPCYSYQGEKTYYRLKQASDFKDEINAYNEAQETLEEITQRVSDKERNVELLKSQVDILKEKLENLNQNYSPLKLTSNLIKDGSEYYYLTEENSFEIIKEEDLQNYINKIVYEQFSLSIIRSELLKIIEEKIINPSSNTTSYTKYEQKIYEYVELYESLMTQKEKNISDDTVNLNNQYNIRLQIGTKFSVNKKGEITATGGTIGGWRISNDSLSGGSLTIKSNGSLSGPGWSIYPDGTATFKNSFNIGWGGISGAGFGWDGGNAHFYGDIYATNGYFSGRIQGSTIEGGTISGSTITGGTITGGTISGATISASGYVTCSGLRVNGVNYGMTSLGMVTHDLNTKSVKVASAGTCSHYLKDSMGGLVTGSITTGEVYVASVSSYGQTKIVFLGSHG